MMNFMALSTTTKTNILFYYYFELFINYILNKHHAIMGRKHPTIYQFNIYCLINSNKKLVKIVDFHKIEHILILLQISRHFVYIVEPFPFLENGRMVYSRIKPKQNIYST